MAIVVNGELSTWREGLTIAELLEEKRFSFPLKTVFVNGERIPRAEHGRRALADGDRVDVMHLMSGG
ncbi:MAG: sulfur carrier protein ThiS [Deltaproteobacteria bacterium]|nr:sulfur carrier protein ThiS [Deltaproteobacteria bacterium]